MVEKGEFQPGLLYRWRCLWLVSGISVHCCVQWFTSVLPGREGKVGTPLQMYVLLFSKWGQGKKFFLCLLPLLNCLQLTTIFIPKWHILVKHVLLPFTPISKRSQKDVSSCSHAVRTSALLPQKDLFVYLILLLKRCDHFCREEGGGCRWEELNWMCITLVWKFFT